MLLPGGANFGFFSVFFSGTVSVSSVAGRFVGADEAGVALLAFAETDALDAA